MEFEQTPRNRVRRIPERGQYDQSTIYAIIDEALICHVAFAVDGQPFVIPTIHARMGDELLLHGAKASRMLKHIQAGHPVSVAITLLDGLVMARSVFHSSMNYRSVVLFGQGRTLEANDEKMAALAVLTEHLAHGRWQEARLPTIQELNGTTVVALKIDGASAKLRSGPPNDEPEDYALPIWAGVLPLQQAALPPVADPKLTPGIEAPGYLVHYQRQG
jgi:nitroimidazol reductase NimA-like FMN-containing flavoprotein (pyridoxamine 5'-phosphate oxidase superfamily)